MTRPRRYVDYKRPGVDVAELTNRIAALSAAVRHRILTMSTAAGSGHPSSSLSSADIAVNLMFGGTFRADLDKPHHPTNDRLIFSKGHASPLFYALFATAGVIEDKELETYRQLGSRLEGHPRPNFPWAEVATGSLGHGLPIGLGMALAARMDGLPYRTFVLLGDSEMAEGSNWEAIQLAAHHKVGNLFGIIDVNRLGQHGQTMYGAHLEAFAERISAFGWQTPVVDGHDHTALSELFSRTAVWSDQPTMIIASTKKGKGVSLLEDKENWHGKALPKDKLEAALTELGEVDLNLRGTVSAPPTVSERTDVLTEHPPVPAYDHAMPVATRTAFGNALVRLGGRKDLVVLDAEVGNSTMTDQFAAAHPEQFFEMYIAEQAQAGAALGMSRRGKKPVAATFAAFLSRSHDQARMAQYSEGDMVFVGSHAGVSIGPDGPSQMALEDIAMFRGLHGSVVLYPADAVSAEKLTELAIRHQGISYLRTTRGATPHLYEANEEFTVGGSKVVRRSDGDVATIIAAGITVHQAVEAQAMLEIKRTKVRVIDLYSIKPLDVATLEAAAKETGRLITVEDHYGPGGLGEAVRTALAGNPVPITSLFVDRIPGSATPEEQLVQAGIDAHAIMEAVMGDK